MGCGLELDAAMDGLGLTAYAINPPPRFFVCQMGILFDPTFNLADGKIDHNEDSNKGIERHLAARIFKPSERYTRTRRYVDGAPLNLSLTCARAKGARSGPVGQPAQGRPCVGRGAASAMCKGLAD
jgi:hypothetical protein